MTMTEPEGNIKQLNLRNSSYGNDSYMRLQYEVAGGMYEKKRSLFFMEIKKRLTLFRGVIMGTLGIRSGFVAYN
mgnify:CR=1 FL=1